MIFVKVIDEKGQPVELEDLTSGGRQQVQFEMKLLQEKLEELDAEEPE